MLKRAGLSREEKQQVLSATGAQYDRTAIERALRRLFKDVEKTDHRSKRYERPQSGYRKPFHKPFRPYNGKSHKVNNADADSESSTESEEGEGEGEKREISISLNLSSEEEIEILTPMAASAAVALVAR